MRPRLDGVDAVRYARELDDRKLAVTIEVITAIDKLG